MSLVTELTRALILVQDEGQLEEWTSALPAGAAAEIRQMLGLRREAECSRALGEWVERHRDEAAELLPILLGRCAGSGTEERSVLLDYLAVLNGVSTAAVCSGLPLVLRGFFHCADCLSYWHFDATRVDALKSFTRDASGDLIKCGGTRPRIFMLGGRASNDRVRTLNLEIRRSTQRCLDRSHYAGRPEVHIVREFRVEFTPGDPDVEIPQGAPGIIEMMATLPLALEAQRAHDVEVGRAAAAADVRC